MARVVFRPRVSRRVPSKTWFAELATAPGPQAIGVTGDNSYAALFGREWLLEWSVEDGMLRLYQESLTQPGEWERVDSPLPPVFDSPLPATARRVTFCFDQSARMIVAYEDEGVIKVTRWDPGSGQYVQNVSFSGVDPAVAMDATWAYDIPNSDILIFYLSTDRTKVLCRVQRELYADEHELWVYDEPVILDRVTPAFLRYQLLVADSAGAPLEKVLLSDPYPYPAFEGLAAGSVLTGSGEYLNVVLNQAAVAAMAAAATLTGVGEYGLPLLQASGTSQLDAGATLTGAGSYAAAALGAAGEDLLDATANLTGAGLYELVVINHSDTTHVLSAAATLGPGGTYGPP